MREEKLAARISGGAQRHLMRSGDFCLLFGLIAGAVFIAASTVLGALLPNYDPITQTISEIGEKGSPFETTFKVTNLFVAACFILFAFGVYRFSKERHFSLALAALLGFKAAMELGVFTFESPHPWHNVFGIAGIFGFFAPLVLAVSWPNTPDLRPVRRVSAIAGLFLTGSIALNLSPLFMQESYIVEHYGLVQRTLLAFHLWCAYLAIVLFHSARQPIRPMVK
jgi:hypothetical membrane protein